MVRLSRACIRYLIIHDTHSPPRVRPRKSCSALGSSAGQKLFAEQSPVMVSLIPVLTEAYME